MSTEEKAQEIPDFSGRYGLERNEDFDVFLAANGAPWIARKMANLSSPDLVVTQEGNKLKFALVSMMQTKETSFTLDEDYEEKQHNDVIMTVQPRLEGQKIVLKYEPKEEFKSSAKEQIHTRELNGNRLILTLQVGDVTAKRIFLKKE